MSKIYRVEGMTCGGCARSVTNAIKAKGADEVEVNLDAKTVTVDGDLDATAVKDAVEDAGFDFHGEVAA